MRFLIGCLGGLMAVVVAWIVVSLVAPNSTVVHLATGIPAFVIGFTAVVAYEIDLY